MGLARLNRPDHEDVFPLETTCRAFFDTVPEFEFALKSEPSQETAQHGSNVPYRSVSIESRLTVTFTEVMSVSA